MAPINKQKSMNLSDILKDSAYKLTQFKPTQIAALEAGITLKTTDKATTPYVNCLVRGKPRKAQNLMANGALE